MLKLNITEDTISFFSPYDMTIAKRCRNLGGNWSGKSWDFKKDDDILASIKSMSIEVFGCSPTDDVHDVYIKIKEDVNKDKAPYIVGGHILSSARSRDSGAAVGKNVILLEGNVFSGGSWKNWVSEIEGGSKFKVKDFPVHYDLSSHEDADVIEITPVNNEVDPRDAQLLIKIKDQELMLRSCKLTEDLSTVMTLPPEVLANRGKIEFVKLIVKVSVTDIELITVDIALDDKYSYLIQVNGIWQITTKDAFDSMTTLHKVYITKDYTEDAISLLNATFDCDLEDEIKRIQETQEV